MDWPNRKKTRQLNNKSHVYSNVSSERQLSDKNNDLERIRWNRSKTQGYSYHIGDSLQSFQQELSSLLQTAQKKKKPMKKKSFLPTIQVEHPKEMSEIKEIKSEIEQIRSMIENKEKRSMEDKLQKIIIELQTQKQRNRIHTERIQMKQSRKYTQSQYHPPVYIPQPQIIYPPQPYFQTPYSHQAEKTHHHRKRRYSPEQSEESEDEYDSKKKNTKELFRARKVDKKNPKTSKAKAPRKNRLKIIFMAALYPILLKYEAKKNAASRRLNLQKFCKQNFYQQINNIKEWLLESQKIPFSIILEKKNLKFNYFTDTSARVREEKLNLIIHIVSIGLKNLEKIAVPDKIESFSELLTKLCLNKSYPINSLWTAEEMKFLCVSEEFGFFKIDQSLEKFLIGLLIFVKIFVFNMLLQPFKFDKTNFEKKTEPMASNMKLISSVYYALVKQVLNFYLAQKRSKTLYRIGNYETAQMAKFKCSEPLIYDNSKHVKSEYISGLYEQKQLEDLKQFQFWELCLKNIKAVIEKIHSYLKTHKK